MADEQKEIKFSPVKFLESLEKPGPFMVWFHKNYPKDFVELRSRCRNCKKIGGPGVQAWSQNFLSQRTPEELQQFAKIIEERPKPGIGRLFGQSKLDKMEEKIEKMEFEMKELLNLVERIRFHLFKYLDIKEE